MNQENNSVFISDGVNVKKLFILLYSYKKVFIISLVFSVFFTYIYLETRPKEYAASVIIQEPNIFENHFIINKYNFLSKEIANVANYKDLLPINNTSFFSMFILIFENQESIYEAVAHLKLVDRANYPSELLYDTALRNEVSKVKIDYKKHTSFESKLWELGKLPTKYVLSAVNEDKKVAVNILQKVIDLINKKGKEKLILDLENVDKFLTFLNIETIKNLEEEIDTIRFMEKYELNLKSKELKMKIKKLPILELNKIKNEITYLKKEIKIAEELGIINPQKFSNDNFAFLVAENDSTYKYHYYDGQIALDIRLKELKEIISSDDALDLYLKSNNIIQYLELEELTKLLGSDEAFQDYIKKITFSQSVKLEEALKGELVTTLNNFKKQVINSQINFVNKSTIQVVSTSINLSIALLIASIFSVIVSLSYIFVRQITKV
ncbi:hypothetical protein N9T16_00875 [Pelagibacteraceae bacterium]|nr:hypothetical protein [Pelagibacteraceae bacterium]